MDPLSKKFPDPWFKWWTTRTLRVVCKIKKCNYIVRQTLLQTTITFLFQKRETKTKLLPSKWMPEADGVFYFLQLCLCIWLKSCDIFHYLRNPPNARINRGILKTAVNDIGDRKWCKFCEGKKSNSDCEFNNPTLMSNIFISVCYKNKTLWNH